MNVKFQCHDFVEDHEEEALPIFKEGGAKDEHENKVCTELLGLLLICVSLRLRVQNAVPAQPCVGKLGISLVLLNILHCNFRLRFKTPLAFKSYPCHASEMTRNTLNHCLKFALRSIFCHICYGKISEKNVNTFIKVKLFISKTSDSCFQGFDFFQMLLASHR